MGPPVVAGGEAWTLCPALVLDVREADYAVAADIKHKLTDYIHTESNMRPQDTENFGPVGTNAAPKDRAPADRIKQLEQELQEYITAEKVMIAAGKVSQATVEQAHEIVRNLK